MWLLGGGATTSSNKYHQVKEQVEPEPKPVSLTGGSLSIIRKNETKIFRKRLEVFFFLAILSLLESHKVSILGSRLNLTNLGLGRKGSPSVLEWFGNPGTPPGGKGLVMGQNVPKNSLLWASTPLNTTVSWPSARHFWPRAPPTPGYLGVEPGCLGVPIHWHPPESEVGLALIFSLMRSWLSTVWYHMRHFLDMTRGILEILCDEYKKASVNKFAQKK